MATIRSSPCNAADPLFGQRNPKRQTTFDHLVRVRRTKFILPVKPIAAADDSRGFHALVNNEDRNALIFDDISTPSTRVAHGRDNGAHRHLDALATRSRASPSMSSFYAADRATSSGGDRAMARCYPETRNALSSHGDILAKVLMTRVSTRCSDHAIAWKGAVTNMPGASSTPPRKREVVIYDYVDDNVPVLAHAAKRRTAYQALGYRMIAAANSTCGGLRHCSTVCQPKAVEPR